MALRGGMSSLPFWWPCLVFVCPVCLLCLFNLALLSLSLCPEGLFAGPQTLVLIPYKHYFGNWLPRERKQEVQLGKKFKRWS